MNNYYYVQGKTQLDIIDKIYHLRKKVWPDFLRVPEENIVRLYQMYADYQIGLIEKKSGDLIAIANSIPIIWTRSFSELPDEGVSWVIHHGLEESYDHRLANTLCLISVSINEKYRNKGISKLLLQRMQNIANLKNIDNIVVPIRPNLKSSYPLIAMSNYVEWKNEKGEIFDPWLRTHVILGANIIKICNRSAVINAPVSQWEEWTGTKFPGEGTFIIDGGLVPLRIHKNNGIYVEENVWVCYQQ